MSFRRGVCPALSAPMQTGDGLLVRLATAGASLTPVQLIALCAAAASHGNGLVEITARGNFQIRGLTDESAPDLADEITAMELGLRDGVPVEANPLAGLDPTESANATPLAGAVREAIDASDLAARLGPKVSVIVDGGGRIGTSAVAADIRFDANSERDWLVSIGGDRSTARALGVCDTEKAIAVTLHLLEMIASRGPDARGRDLPASAMPRHLLRPAAVATATSRPQYPFGQIRLGIDRFAYGVGLPFGQVAASDLSQFATALEWQGITQLRMSPGRALLTIGTGECAPVEEHAKAIGLIVDAADPRARIFACPGSAGCASGHIAAREIAAAVARELPSAADAETDLHISGCPKGCAHPAPASLTLLGTENGTVIVENGTTRENGISFGNQHIARRLASEVARRAGNAELPVPGERAQSEQAFAGE